MKHMNVCRLSRAHRQTHKSVVGCFFVDNIVVLAEPGRIHTRFSITRATTKVGPRPVCGFHDDNGNNDPHKKKSKQCGFSKILQDVTHVRRPVNRFNESQQKFFSKRFLNALHNEHQ
jgi:hypothetical protein